MEEEIKVSDVKNKVTIIVAEGCPYCEELKKIKSDEIEIIDVNNERTKDFIGDADKFNIPLAFDSNNLSCEIIIGKNDEPTIISCKDKVLISSEDETVVLDIDDNIEEDIEENETELEDEISQ